MKHPIKIKVDKATAWRIFVDVCTVVSTLAITIGVTVVLILVAKGG